MPKLAVIIPLNNFVQIGSLGRTLNVYRKFAEDDWDVIFFTCEQTHKDIDIDFKVEIVPQFLTNCCCLL